MNRLVSECGPGRWQDTFDWLAAPGFSLRLAVFVVAHGRGGVFVSCGTGAAITLCVAGSGCFMVEPPAFIKAKVQMSTQPRNKQANDQ
jgi:hypothetical protein